MSPGAAIAVSGVRKSFEGGRVSALRNVSFEVAPGELVALTGASVGPSEEASSDSSSGVAGSSEIASKDGSSTGLRGADAVAAA